MTRFHIHFAEKDLSNLEKAVVAFNGMSAYWSDVKMLDSRKISTLSIPMDEAPIFLRDFLKELSQEAREGLRQQLVEQIEKASRQEPGSYRISKALTGLKALSF